MNKVYSLMSVVAFAALLVASSDVLEYKDSNFDSNIKQHELALAEFYAPWCGHCKKLAPEYEKAATILKANDPPVALIKVDCTAETKTCGKYDVNGYPTLKIFKHGEPTEYNGPRDADGIVKYLRSKAGPTVREINTIEEAEKFLSNSEHSIFGLFSSPKTLLATEFSKVADALAEEFRFAATSSPDVLAKYNHKDQVVIYQPPRLQVKLESTENVYTGEASKDKIKEFIQSEIDGIVGHRTSDNAKRFKNPLVVVYYNVDYVKDVKGTNYVRNRVIKVAQKLKSECLNVRFAVSSAEDLNSEITEHGLEYTSGQKFVLGFGPNGEKFAFNGEYSPESLEKFARDLSAGVLEPFLKSEPVPTENPDAVKTVVAKNFDTIVNDPTKDVLIEFYAPWCGHCKTLAPKYEELAKKLQDESDIVIAKMDATANDVPSLYDVKGFPTLYFVPKNSKKSPLRYNGGRETDDFIKYLAKESTDPLGGYDRNGKKQKNVKKEKSADL